MFCRNCGKPVDGVSRYCPNCGAVQNNTAPIQPVLNKVNVDDTLPKNSNFILTLAFIALVIFVSFIFLGMYRTEYDYKQSVKYKEFKVYYPLGFKTQIGDDDDKETDESKKSLYVYNDDIKYQINYYLDDYSAYNKPGYQTIKDFLKKQNYDLKDIYEKTYDDHGMIIAKFTMDGDTTMYFYLYEAKKDGLVYMGYMSDSKDLDKDLERLVTILSKMERI